MKKFVITTALLILLPVTNIIATTRTALVIGNSTYLSAPLKNPINDANDIAAVLKEYGFSVDLILNGSKRAMKNAVRVFGNRLKDGGVGLFYYAGHGVQLNGRNYLIPVNALIESESDVEFEALDAGRILGKMEDAGNDLNIVILDACRNNPFSRAFRSPSRGLARMDAPTGSIIVYATAPGSVAADGDGRNGIYTKHLLEIMKKPGLKIEEVLKNVRIAVLSDTNKKQTPWESSSLTGNFYFIKIEDSNVTIVNDNDISDQDKTNQDQENIFWQSIKDSDKPEHFHAYLKQYPEGAFASLAILQLQEIEAKEKRIKTKKKFLKESGSEKTANPGDIWTDPLTGMDFVWVPKGCFQMGRNIDDSDEKPIHEVCIDGFWIGKYEVTQKQWQKIRIVGPFHFPRGNDYPVENVSWNSVKNFISELNRRTGNKFSLPSEAQWEYAARSGGKNEKYSGGDNVDSVAWYRSNSGETTHPVGTKLPNGLGIYDMSGNVWEWCEDVYDKDAYSKHSRNNPLITSGSSHRVNRGGAWGLKPSYVRSTNREKDKPSYATKLLGFRLIRTD